MLGNIGHDVYSLGAPAPTRNESDGSINNPLPLPQL